MRSNGSRWCPGRVLVCSAWLRWMGSVCIAFWESCSATNRCRSPGISSLPRAALMEISHPLAALKNSSFRPSEVKSLALLDSLGSSVIHHRKTWVSSSTLTARRFPGPPPEAGRRSPRRPPPDSTPCPARAAPAAPSQGRATGLPALAMVIPPPGPPGPVTSTGASWPRERLPSWSSTTLQVLSYPSKTTD